MNFSLRLRNRSGLLLRLKVLALGLAAASLLAAAPARQLRFVVLLTRHGVRSPTWTAEQLKQYSKEAWPNWGVPPTYLTARGKEQMTLLGAYDREYLAHAGLLSKECADAGRSYFWADIDQRTMESARALAAGLVPGCTVEIHSQPGGKNDPLFSAVKAGLATADRQRAVAAILGRIGGHPEALLAAYRPAFAALERVLQKPLRDQPVTVVPGQGEILAELRGPLSTASTLAENLLLEYANGMEGKDLGWGKLSASDLREIMALHTAFADLTRRTSYIARAHGSNLLSHIAASMQQAVRGASVPGAMGKAANRLLVIVGHDTNITNLAGMLGVSWLIPGYQRDDTPPGGALVFELWCAASGEACDVRTYYTSQTFDQLHEAQPLTLASPPATAPVFVPGCSSAADGFACEWKDFERTVEGAIDPAFVTP